MVMMLALFLWPHLEERDLLREEADIPGRVILAIELMKQGSRPASSIDVKVKVSSSIVSTEP